MWVARMMIYTQHKSLLPRTHPDGQAHLSTSVGDADVAARVTLLRKLAGEEVVQLGAEDTVSDELALLADLGGHLDGVLAGENGG